MGRPFQPLQGVRVVDLSRFLPGPFLTRILADLGADVIKIEAPSGDTLRWVGPHVEGVGAAYASLNAGKRGVRVDLKKPQGAALVRAAAARADVVVAAFRPGVLDRLGLGVDALHAANPRLVSVSLTGFGERTGRATVPGHDLSYAAVAGVLGLQGPADGPPAVPALQLADVGGGTLPAAIGVLAALLERHQTGRGRHLDVSLTRGLMGFATYAMAAAAHGHVAERGAGMLTGGAPCYRCYRTADDRWMAVAALEPQFFGALCGVLGCPEHAGAGLATGEEAEPVIAALEAAFASATQAEWVVRLAGVPACCEAVRTPAEALDDPDVATQSWAGPHAVVHLDVGAGRPQDTSPLAWLGREELATVMGVEGEVAEAAARSGAWIPGG